MKHLAGTYFMLLSNSLFGVILLIASSTFLSSIFQLLYVVAWLIVDMSYSIQTSLKKRFLIKQNFVFPITYIYSFSLCVLVKLTWN